MSLALLLRETSTLQAGPRDINGMFCFSFVPWSPFQARTARSGDLCSIGTKRTKKKTGSVYDSIRHGKGWKFVRQISFLLLNCRMPGDSPHWTTVGRGPLTDIVDAQICRVYTPYGLMPHVCCWLIFWKRLADTWDPFFHMPGTVNSKRLCASRKSSFLTMSGRPLEFVYLSCRRDTAVLLQLFRTYCEAHLYSHSPHFDILPIGALVPQEWGWALQDSWCR